MVTPGRKRQLIVYYSDQFTTEDIRCCTERCPGDWVCISDQPFSTGSLRPDQTFQLLGQEFLHAIFDGRQGFSLDAFLILAGTLQRDSILLLVLPIHFGMSVDRDSIRWNGMATATPAPNFSKHLSRIFDQHGTCVITQRAELDQMLSQASGRQTQTQLSMHLPTSEQQSILMALQSKNVKIALLTAKRGRGKSTLAAFFSYYQPTWICVAHKKNATLLRQFSKEGTRIWAPDELIRALKAGCAARPDWLIVDEAAMIPIALLTTLVTLMPRILFISTCDGYEGTGQGFWLAFRQRLTSVTHFQLHKPIRFSMQDPLEAITEAILLVKAQDTVPLPLLPKDKLVYDFCDQCSLAEQTDQLQQFYALLKEAHYKTTTTDLRRLLDAKKTHIVRAIAANHTYAAALVIEEGGLDPELSQQIWAGIRRPRGNLVAQSLAAHANEKCAAEFASLRINRLAVQASLRRQGIGRNMVARIVNYGIKNGYDFISVSFSYCVNNYAFWIACGFQPVHVSFQCDTSTGQYSVMAIRTCTEAARHMQTRLALRLHRNAAFYPHYRSLPFFIFDRKDMVLQQDDWNSLAVFAYAQGSYNMAYAALCRLQHHYPELTIVLECWAGRDQKAIRRAQRVQVREIVQQHARVVFRDGVVFPFC